MARKAKVKSITAKTAVSNPVMKTVNPGFDLPTIGANMGSLSQDRDQAEMAQAKSNMRVKAKAMPAKAPMAAPIDTSEPLSPQSWVNQGMDPLKYDEYLASHEQMQQKSGKRKSKVKMKGTSGSY